MCILFLYFCDKEYRVTLSVMGGHEVFGEIVTKVFTVRLPVNKEVTLFDMISYPAEPRIYCLERMFLVSVICNVGIILLVCISACEWEADGDLSKRIYCVYVIICRLYNFEQSRRDGW